MHVFKEPCRKKCYFAKYKLVEERYIVGIDKYIENYKFIKKFFGKRVDELYSNENHRVLPYSSTYQVIKRGFIKSALWENQNYGCI